MAPAPTGRKSSRVATADAAKQVKAAADASKVNQASAAKPAKRNTKKPASLTAPKANTGAKRTTTETKAAAAKAKASKDVTDASTKRGRPAKDEAKPTKQLAKTTKKRKTPDQEDAGPTTKKPKVEKAEKVVKVVKPKATPKPRLPKLKVIVNQPHYTEKVNVYVFGEGSNGELGLGSAKNAIDVKRPRLNPNLLADKVGIVKIATGGMHCVALSHDNQIYTWGVNDQGALGRDTTWDDAKMKDADDNGSDSDSDDDDDSGMNPREATPTAIPQEEFPAGTTFVDVAAGDSISFALTDDGLVYGWGTFRKNEGILGFSTDIEVQTRPKLIPKLSKITHIACGANHVLVIDNAHNVYAWGSGQQNQLGRRLTERTMKTALVPSKVIFNDSSDRKASKKITHISCGDYHTFAIGSDNHVWAFGSNNYGETGIPDNAGTDNASLVTPQIVTSLDGKNVKCIKGGAHHSVAVTENGECLVWGRVDGYQMGIKVQDLCDDDVIKDKNGNPKILTVPAVIPGLSQVAWATCGTDHAIAVTEQGQAYSWGFSANYQTGLGTDEDVEVATLIDNTAVRCKKLNWAGAGGQYSILTALAEGGEAHDASNPQ